MESLGAIDVKPAQVIYCNTYFGIIAEFFHSVEYANKLSLISKFHYDFPKNECNYQIMLRVLSREFFDIKNMSKLINVNSSNIYDNIRILHHFYDDINQSDNKNSSITITKWMKRDFLSRWRYLTSYNNVQLYGIKYWLTKLFQTAATNDSNSEEENIQFVCCNNYNDLVTTMILHSNMNGDKNTFNIDSCTKLMDWFVNYNGYLPPTTEFTRLLVSTLDVNQNRKNINHSMFAWSLNYLCLYFENKLNEIENNNNNNGIINVDIVQQLSTLIAELILTLHTANIEHNIYKQKEKMDLFHSAMNKYSIPRRFKKIWLIIMGGNMINFTAGFTLTVSSFFNSLMHL